MNFLVLILDAAVLSWISIRLFRIQPQILRPYFWPALVLKILAGMAVGVIYFFHYGAGDTISYWEDGLKISAYLTSTPGDAITFFWDESNSPGFVATLMQQAPRSLFFSKISGILAFIAAGNYWMMASILSFVSFLGTWYLFRCVCDFFPLHQNAAAVAFLLFPSVVFWSSGLIKESPGLASLYFLIAVILCFLHDRKLSALVWFMTLISLWIGWNLKYYWIGMFLPVVIPTAIVHLIKRSRPPWSRYEIPIWTMLFLIFLVFATSIHPNFYPSRFLEVIYQSNLDFTQHSNPPRIIQYLNLEPSIASMLMNVPAAWIAGLFRPFVWEAFNFLSLLAGIENLALLIAVVMALPALMKFRSSPHRLPVLGAIVYIILLTGFLALSTPNFGTLSRYKIGAVPILLFICLCVNPVFRRWFEKHS